MTTQADDVFEHDEEPDLSSRPAAVTGQTSGDEDLQKVMAKIKRRSKSRKPDAWTNHVGSDDRGGGRPAERSTLQTEAADPAKEPPQDTEETALDAQSDYGASDGAALPQHWLASQRSIVVESDPIAATPVAAIRDTPETSSSAVRTGLPDDGVPRNTAPGSSTFADLMGAEDSADTEADKISWLGSHDTPGVSDAPTPASSGPSEPQQISLTPSAPQGEGRHVPPDVPSPPPSRAQTAPSSAVIDLRQSAAKPVAPVEVKQPATFRSGAFLAAGAIALVLIFVFIYFLA